MPSSLTQYEKKRDFEVTSEPRSPRSEARAHGAPIFVVQKHDASHLHYDFRLEHDGVLWSWAIPKGPSLDPAVRRLAVRTEDHPVDYAGFEGTIPAGEYGGGSVIVWDRGTWAPTGDPDAAMKKGHLRFALKGEKLEGTFHLVRSKPRGREKESWLLFKSKDDAARVDVDVVASRPESVLSGRTIDDVRAGRTGAEGTKRTRRATPKAGRARRRRKPESDSVRPGTVADALGSMGLGFEITSPDKVLYPDARLTKADLMGYLAFIAPRMLPLVRGRPLMLLRCPDGVDGPRFFQKHVGSGVPSAVHRVRLREKTARGDSLFVDDVAGLVALGQMGALEVHTWMCRVDRPERPDQIVLDVDPDEGLPFARVIETALALRKLLRRVGLAAFVKTTGGKGLHVVAPLTPGHDWETHERFARTLVEHLARKHPDRYVVTMNKAARRGKIFLDWLRNGRGATAVAPLSPRARAGAPVAWPIPWSALEVDLDPRRFTVRSAIEADVPRVDPWKGYFDADTRLDVRALRSL